MTVLCLVLGGAIIIGERCMAAHDLHVIQKEKTP